MLEIKDKTIVVTGGAGFIGSNLCDYFVKNNQVIALDNLSTGRLTNLKHLKSLPNFQFIEGDIADTEFCNDVIPEKAFITHNAALGSVSRSIEKPLNTNHHNITAFLNVLETARLKKATKFVYASSSSTYGDHEALPKIEQNIGAPLSPYAVTKLANELYAKVYHNIYNFPIIGLRYFNVFGQNQDPSGPYAAVIPRFLNAMMNGEPITIFGDGEQTRDFTHVSNVISAIQQAFLSTNEAAYGEVFNIAFGARISLNSLVEIIQRLLMDSGKITVPVNVKYLPPRIGDIRNSFASIEKAKSMLGYHPETSLEEGLKILIDQGVG